MGQWQILGTDVGFGIDEWRVHASGTAKHYCRPDLHHVDLEPIKGLGAAWEIHRASESIALARDIVRMKMFLYSSRYDSARVNRVNNLFEVSLATVAAAERPVAIVSYQDSVVGFCIFLPDRQFDVVWELLKLVSSGPRMQYTFNLDFAGFLPKPAPENPEYISFEEWVAGRDYVAVGMRFRVDATVGQVTDTQF